MTGHRILPSSVPIAGCDVSRRMFHGLSNFKQNSFVFKLHRVRLFKVLVQKSFYWDVRHNYRGVDWGKQIHGSLHDSRTGQNRSVIGTTHPLQQEKISISLSTSDSNWLNRLHSTDHHRLDPESGPRVRLRTREFVIRHDGRHKSSLLFFSSSPLLPCQTFGDMIRSGLWSL